MLEEEKNRIMPQISVNGTSICYEVNGKGHPLVFIHAGGLESSSWNAQVDYFSERYKKEAQEIKREGDKK